VGLHEIGGVIKFGIGLARSHGWAIRGAELQRETSRLLKLALVQFSLLFSSDLSFFANGFFSKAAFSAGLTRLKMNESKGGCIHLQAVATPKNAQELLCWIGLPNRGFQWWLADAPISIWSVEGVISACLRRLSICSSVVGIDCNCSIAWCWISVAVSTFLASFACQQDLGCRSKTCYRCGFPLMSKRHSLLSDISLLILNGSIWLHF